MKHLLIALVALLTLDANAQTETAVTIDPQKATTSESLFESYSIVALQSSKESQMSPLSVGKIKKYLDKYVISDIDDNSLLIFDSNGNFINKIKLQSSIMDFDIYNNAIYILDNSDNQHIIKYSIDGNYATQYLTGSWYKNLVVLNGKDILLFSNHSNNSGFNYVIFNAEKQQTTISWEPMKNEHFTYAMNPFSRIGNEVFATKAFDHTIYRFCGNNLCPYLNLEFANTDKLPKAKTILKKIETAGKVVDKIEDITRTNRNLCFSYSLKNNGRFMKYICSIDSKNNLTANVPMFNQAQDAKFPVAGTFCSLTEGHCIMYLSVSEAQALSGNGNFTPADAEKLKNAGNLVILDYKLK